MDYLFLDTSAFLKLYLNEAGSNWLKAFVIGKKVGVSQLVFVEVATTLGRLYREGVYTQTQVQQIYAQVRSDRYLYEVEPLGTKLQTKRVADLAFNLPVNLRIRALDGLHIAAAQTAQNRARRQRPPASFTFVSSDLQLLRVAQAQQFPVENPEDYP